MIADDLFAGAGGWDLAARDLGIEARGVENMPEARATRDAAGLTTIHDDVWTYKPRYLGRELTASGLIASPPCPTFSTAGKGSGRKAMPDILALIPKLASMTLAEVRAAAREFDDDRTGLVLSPLWFAIHHAYQWLAWEQVSTVLPIWEACADVLRELGWNVWTGRLLSEQYGVPQTRGGPAGRAFLIASHLGPVAPPTPTHSRFYSRSPQRLDEGVPKWISMAEGLGWGLLHRPSYTVTGGSSHAASGIEWGGKSVRDLLMDTATDPTAWRLKGWGLTERPAPTVTGGGTETGGAEPIAKLARYTSRDDWMPKRSHMALSGSSCTIMDPRSITEPSPTVTGKGNAEWTDRNRRAVVGELRDPEAIRLTPAEAGVLQTFPADYPWQGTKGKQFLQAGNAVPPLLARHALSAAAVHHLAAREAVA